MNNQSKLGQNFLIDSKIVDKITELSRIGRHEVVYEVGTGKGVLTKELCRIAKFVYSFELDSKLYDQSKEHLRFKNLKLSNSDGLDRNFIIDFDVFLSSLPYYESRRALSWLCQKQFKRAIILLQREFVEKLLSKPGNSNYRAITVFSQYRFSISILLDVPSSSFSPKPKVDSLLIELCPKTPPLSLQLMRDIQSLFSFRKKTVSFVLNYFKKHYSCDFDTSDLIDIESNRIAQLSPTQILHLNKSLKNNLYSKNPYRNIPN
ncbi:MAG: hypothetical protein M3Y25_00225 [Thermoproteota archaeon]|nr:hypothetical protein [Thermoproteota archaeon]